MEGYEAGKRNGVDMRTWRVRRQRYASAPPAVAPAARASFTMSLGDGWWYSGGAHNRRNRSHFSGGNTREGGGNVGGASSDNQSRGRQLGRTGMKRLRCASTGTQGYGTTGDASQSGSLASRQARRSRYNYCNGANWGCFRVDSGQLPLVQESP